MIWNGYQRAWVWGGDGEKFERGESGGGIWEGRGGYRRGRTGEEGVGVWWREWSWWVGCLEVDYSPPPRNEGQTHQLQEHLQGGIYKGFSQSKRIETSRFFQIQLTAHFTAFHIQKSVFCQTPPCYNHSPASLPPRVIQLHNKLSKNSFPSLPNNPSQL